MAHKHQGYRFENDWEIEVLENDSKRLAAAVTLPVFEEVKAGHTVLNLDSVKKILEKSPKIAVTKCACRDKRKHCDAPVEVCLEINEMAEKDLAKGTTTQALDVVKKSHEAGLISMAYIMMDASETNRPHAICQCCSCCCAELGLTLRYGMAPHLLKSTAISRNDD
jgi:hypothetical protein